MKRLFTIAAVAALVVGCGGGAAPTPQIVYVTPAPAGAAPGTVKPIATPTEAPDVTPEPLPEETGNSAGQKVGRRIWSHLGWRNTAGLRRANYDRSGGFTL